MAKNVTVVFEGVKKVALKEGDAPSPGAGQMLVRTTKTAISTGTELTILSGEYPPGSNWSKYGRFPFTAGYANVGKVMAVGAGVSDFAVGDRVASTAPHTRYALCAPGSVHRVPGKVGDEVAATYILAQIALNGVRRAEVRMGESAVVFGLGVIGLMTAQLLRLDGARPVIGVDLSADRRRMAEQVGVDVVLDGAEDLSEKVKQATRGRMADMVIEVTGNPKIIPKEMSLLRRLGRIVILSSPRGVTEFDFHDFCNGPSYTIIGAHNGSHPAHETPYNPWTAQRNVELFFDFVERGEMRVAELITHRYNWSDAPAAYDLLLTDRGKAGAVILDWEGES